MGASSILYPIIAIFCLYLIYNNIKNNIQYKKENIEAVLTLNEDDKTMRTASRLLLALMIFSSGYLTIATLTTTGRFTTDTFLFTVLPIQFIIIYIPLSKKTRITTLGIYKRSNLIRWEDIKGIDYLKPDAKGKQKAKILHKTSYGKDNTMELLFKKDDEQLIQFKNAAKEFRNKKKDNKSGK